MSCVPGDRFEEATLQEICKVEGTMEQALADREELLPDIEANVAVGVDGAVKKFAGRPMITMPPMGRSEIVLNEIVVTPVVVRCATLSPAAKVSETLETRPPIAIVENIVALTSSALVATVKPVETDSLGAPVVSCPASNVMICAPAGSAAPAVVHTMVRVSGVMAHPDNVAEPDSGVSVPPGVAGPVK